VTDLQGRIAAVLGRFIEVSMSGPAAKIAHEAVLNAMAAAVVEELGPVPDRTHTDDMGRKWEWCGGVPGTWGWRVTEW
jgi:hypothetical protein